MSDRVIELRLGQLPYEEEIIVVAGNTASRKYKLQYNDTTALGLANTTMVLNISTHKGAGAASVTGTEIGDLTGASGVKILSESGGQFQRWMRASDMGTALKPGNWWWAVIATFATEHSQLAEHVLTFLEGPLRIREGAIT